MSTDIPLSEARALDKRVRVLSARLIADAEKLVALIEQAERGDPCCAGLLAEGVGF